LQRGQERILSTVMANDKLLRLIESAAINGENGQDLGVAELLDNLRNGLFADLLGTGTPDVFRRNLQRTYVANLVAKLSAPAPSLTPISTMSAMFAPPNVYKTDVRALVRAQLETLAAKLKKSGGSDIAKAHKKDLLVIIDDALRASKDR
ncbi:MAG: hypothetical protein ACKOAG_05265, partial [Candidatus Kapaibacterium sp.]